MRGSMLDLPVIIIVLFGFGIACIIGYTILSAFEAKITNTHFLSVIGNTKTALQLMDGGLVFIQVMLMLTTLVGAFMIRTHPIFFAVSTILLMISVMISAVFSNVYEEFVGEPAFSVAVAQYPMSMIALDKLPITLSVIGIVLLVVMYGKQQKTGLG